MPSFSGFTNYVSKKSRSFATSVSQAFGYGSPSAKTTVILPTGDEAKQRDDATKLEMEKIVQEIIASRAKKIQRDDGQRRKQQQDILKKPSDVSDAEWRKKKLEEIKERDKERREKSKRQPSATPVVKSNEKAKAIVLATPEQEQEEKLAYQQSIKKQQGTSSEDRAARQKALKKQRLARQAEEVAKKDGAAKEGNTPDTSRSRAESAAAVISSDEQKEQVKQNTNAAELINQSTKALKDIESLLNQLEISSSQADKLSYKSIPQKPFSLDEILAKGPNQSRYVALSLDGKKDPISIFNPKPESGKKVRFSEESNEKEFDKESSPADTSKARLIRTSTKANLAR